MECIQILVTSRKSFFFLSLFTLGILFFLACKKVSSCDNCGGNNKTPIAKAGSDTSLVLPLDSMLLDGSNSYDPDGSIREYLWSKISGNAPFTIINSQTSKPLIKNLTAGVYQFELKVTDNGGLIAKDSIIVTVKTTSTNNNPPIANAGTDMVITLPNNTANLNGGASADPDNNITGYQWSKISGPPSFSIANPGSSQTQVTSLSEGIYQFELKVSDGSGLFSYDTVQITVYPVVIVDPCSNRPVINVNLLPTDATAMPCLSGIVSSAVDHVFVAML